MPYVILQREHSVLGLLQVQVATCPSEVHLCRAHRAATARRTHNYNYNHNSDGYDRDYDDDDDDYDDEEEEFDAGGRV